MLPSLAFISSFCLSLTFFGFFALTGPSALLSFHYPRLQISHLSFSQIICKNSPYRHIGNMGIPLACPLHLQRHQKLISSMFQGRRNAISPTRRSDSAQGRHGVLNRECRTLSYSRDAIETDDDGLSIGDDSTTSCERGKVMTSWLLFSVLRLLRQHRPMINRLPYLFIPFHPMFSPSFF